MAASQTLRTLKLSLLADVSEFGKGMGKATSDFQKFSRNVEQASRVATGVIGVLGGIAASSIQAASDLSETSSAVEQIFGPRAAQDLQNFARTAARSIGQSRQQALEAAQGFGIFGKAAGLTGDELVEFTTDLVTLAADLASFNNTTVDQAITALGAALRGESEPIRNYGVLLNAAAIENRALADGLIESGQELDQQGKILATFNEIFAQTGIQQGDFARTSEGLANSQKTLTSEIQNFRVEIGEELLPIVEDLLPKIRGFVDTLLAADPEQIIETAEAIGILAGVVVTLNAALKTFATVQAAARFLFTATGAIGLTAAAGGSLNQDPTNPLYYEDRGYSPQEADRLAAQASRNPVPLRSPGRNPLTGAGRSQASQPIIVNGVVGSTYQVFRELERIDAAGRSSGTTIPTRIR